MASLYSSSLCLSSLWLSYNHCCDAWTSIIISGLTSSTQYRTKQVDSITGYCGVVHAAVICLGIIRRHLNFQCLSPGGQPHWPASTDWFIAWARRQAVASLRRWTKLETAFSRTFSFSWAHLWYVSLRELLSLREDIKRNVSFFRALPKLGGWGVWP